MFCEFRVLRIQGISHFRHAGFTLRFLKAELLQRKCELLLLQLFLGVLGIEFNQDIARSDGGSMLDGSENLQVQVGFELDADLRRRRRREITLHFDRLLDRANLRLNARGRSLLGENNRTANRDDYRSRAPLGDMASPWSDVAREWREHGRDLLESVENELGGSKRRRNLRSKEPSSVCVPRDEYRFFH